MQDGQSVSPINFPKFFQNYFDVFTMPWNKWDPNVPQSPNFNIFGQTYEII